MKKSFRRHVQRLEAQKFSSAKINRADMKSKAGFGVSLALAAVSWSLIATAYACGSLAYYDPRIIGEFSLIDLQSIALADIAAPLFFLFAIVPAAALNFLAKDLKVDGKKNDGFAHLGKILIYTLPLAIPLVIFYALSFFLLIPVDSILGGAGDFFLFAWIAIAVGLISLTRRKIFSISHRLGLGSIAIGVLMLSYMAGDLSSSLKVRQNELPLLKKSEGDFPVLIATPNGHVIRLSDTDVAVVQHGDSDFHIFRRALEKLVLAQKWKAEKRLKK